ncbi:MAG: NFACT RNA binding domain-containing protein [Desulfovibrio sp.]|uniref:NFACT RNA binding domain-containing protein n=1 Tax=Desulfovibrio sp. TaxID=885 RepID=UPI002A3650B0|nr:NFACT RNA binding domain-containing protein [Desulfovibrio sp.]MDY0259419.1 NFACT RNA binding domain-containing protein [Desulfovibrio sp.]
MDAHLFRRLCEDLTPQLAGARIEKLQEPAPGLLVLTWYGGGRKRQLCLRHARKEPFCFLSASRITAGKAPSAQIMRLRKYASGRRIASCVVRFCDRQLWLLLAGGDSGLMADQGGKGSDADAPRLAWLLLDLREGPSLHFLTEGEAPEEEAPDWPGPDTLAQALQDWRAWPVLTPALRRTLTCLEEPEQWALMEDLRAGGGDVFCYGPALPEAAKISVDGAGGQFTDGQFPDDQFTDGQFPGGLAPAGDAAAPANCASPTSSGSSDSSLAFTSATTAAPADSGLFPGRSPRSIRSIRAVSAWPLPPQQCAALLTEDERASGLVLREECSADVLGLTEKAGQDMVLARLAGEQAKEAALPLDRRGRKLTKLLDKLREEERRLTAMTEAQADALALQENLWQWPAEYRALSVTVAAGAHGPAREIRLDPRRNVREEMARLFHTARRGWRGLEHLAQRRGALEQEMTAIARARRDSLLGAGGGQAGCTQTGGGQTRSGQPISGQTISGKPGSGQTLSGKTGGAGTLTGAAAGIPTALPKNVQLFISSDGFALLRGRDAKGNLAARKLAAPHDIWLHAENGPGSHVIIRRTHGGQDVPVSTLDEAGSLAASKSWQKDAARARIQYAEVRHVKPMRNAPAGTVRIDKVLASREVPVDATLEEKLLPE